jgi:hypothetical protein
MLTSWSGRYTTVTASSAVRRPTSSTLHIAPTRPVRLKVDVEALTPYPEREVLAGGARLAHLEEHVVDAPSLAEKGSGHVEAHRTQVLAEVARSEVAVQLRGEVVGVLDGVHVDGCVSSAVRRVELPISFESSLGDQDRTGHGALVDGGVVEVAGTDGVDDADVGHAWSGPGSHAAGPRPVLLDRGCCPRGASQGKVWPERVMCVSPIGLVSSGTRRDAPRELTQVARRSPPRSRPNRTHLRRRPTPVLPPREDGRCRVRGYVGCDEEISRRSIDLS